MEDEDLFECPNCSAIWGFDEIQFQHCDCCGYPNHQEEPDEDDVFDLAFEDSKDY